MPTANNHLVGLRAEREALCGHNLGTQGTNLRLRGAIVMVTVGLALACWLVQDGAPRWTRALCFVPFFMAAFGAMQGLLRTCPLHSMKRTREDDAGRTERVVTAEEQRSAQRLARFVWVGSAALAVAATVSIVIVP
jgi:hypothetical protein